MFVEEKKQGEVKELDDASKTLLKAAALMEKHGIAKGMLKDAEGRLCMLGAIYEAGSYPIDWNHSVPSASRQAWERLKTVMAINDPCIWNNAPERTCEEAVAKLRAAAFSSR